MTENQVPNLETVEDMLAFVLAVENEASERYAEMAEAMDAHNNTQVAKLFREMADVEELHAESVQRQAAKLGIEALPVLQYEWETPEGPETGDFADLHYLMTPREALLLARHNEEKAAAYFAELAEKLSNPEVKAMAREMATEEREHVALVNKWLEDFPEDESEWIEDQDPPVDQG